jgi:formyl-CoA transferase
MAGVVPRLSRTPGVIRHPGPALGEHTAEILRALASCTDDELAALRDAGVIA